MTVKNIEIQDDLGNIYYPHTDASVVKCGDRDVATQLSENTQNIAQLSNPNLLINGDFQIWQRGTSFTSNIVRQYTADRWWVAGDTECSVTKTAKGIKLKTGKVGTWTNFGQILEDDFLAKLVGKTVTITWKMTTPNTNVGQLWCGGNGVYHNTYFPTASTDTVSMTFPITKATTTTEFGLQMKSDVVGREIEIEWVKLEIGNKATPFVARLFGEELLLCQRYYELGYSYRGVIGNSFRLDTTISYKANKRINPSITLIGNNVANKIMRESDGQLFDYVIYQNWTSSFGVIDLKMGVTNSDVFAFNWIADAEMY